ncbi:hypothetical protein AcV7_010336 [Taiwanofungus camphoratus]|nr:hypothetical protein AcV7_010336 [Antrodia cinnamomea]
MDLLERYRGLVALGKIKYDEEQIRVVMQLRRLQKDLDGYAPPALSSRYLQSMEDQAVRAEAESRPWWPPQKSRSRKSLWTTVPSFAYRPIQRR